MTGFDSRENKNMNGKNTVSTNTDTPDIRKNLYNGEFDPGSG